jgi:hypothetical protein
MGETRRRDASCHLRTLGRRRFRWFHRSEVSVIRDLSPPGAPETRRAFGASGPASGSGNLYPGAKRPCSWRRGNSPGGQFDPLRAGVPAWSGVKRTQKQPWLTSLAINCRSRWIACFSWALASSQNRRISSRQPALAMYWS